MVLEKDMYDTVRKNIRSRFPEHEGWEIYFQDNWGGYKPDFVAERSNGSIERVIVEVKATCKATKADVAQVNKYARNLAGNNVSILAKILVYPSGANISEIPDDIEVMNLRKFNCE